MMMTLGTAATRISSTSKRSGAGGWRWVGGGVMNSSHLTPINLPMMSNGSPLSGIFPSEDG